MIATKRKNSITNNHFSISIVFNSPFNPVGAIYKTLGAYCNSMDYSINNISAFWIH